MEELAQKDGTIVVDCRQLEPPEPMIAILEAIEKMKPDEKILVLHRKNPVLLYEKLTERNCAHQLKTFIDGSIELLIWRVEE